MKKAAWIPTLLGALAVLATACTNKQGETEAPVFLTVEITGQPIVVNVGAVAPVLGVSVAVASHLKNPSQTDPQGFADTMLESYTVHFSRIDGGTRVPPDQTLAAGILVPSGGTGTLTPFTILPASLIQQSPFDQLLPFNGGFDRETGRDEIDLAYSLTFFGHTVSGLRVQSETGVGRTLQFRFVVSASTSKNGNR